VPFEGIPSVDTGLDRVAARITPLIRNRAVEAGWPEEVASRMSMIRTANGLAVHAHPDVRAQAEDLEYGSATSAPRSALAMLHSPKMKQEMKTIAHDSMDELLDQMRRVFK
jgi:hypothetical protein